MSQRKVSDRFKTIGRTIPATLLCLLVAGCGTGPGNASRAAAPIVSLPTEGWEISEQAMELNTSNLRAISFATPLCGAMAGEGPMPKIAYSRDGGVTWQPAGVDLDISKGNMFDLIFTDEKTGWLIGRVPVDAHDRHRAVLLRSDDAGAIWKEVPLPAEVANSNAFRVWFDKQGNGWILPYSGAVVFRTADSGQTWTKFTMPVAMNQRGGGAWHVFDCDRLVVCNTDGRLAKTADGGKTWTESGDSVPDVYIGGLSFANEIEGWAVGTKGVILHTADGGKTWTKQNSTVTCDLERVQFLSPLEGYAVGLKASIMAVGALLHTTDGGRTWRNINPTSCSLIGLFLLDAKHGWACGGRGGGYETQMMIVRYKAK